MGPDPTGPSRLEFGDRKFRGHQGCKSSAKTDDTRGSETPKERRGDKQLNKVTHEGTAICMNEIFFFFKVSAGWGFCTRGFPLGCLSRPTVKVLFKDYKGLSWCGGADF